MLPLEEVAARTGDKQSGGLQPHVPKDWPRTGRVEFRNVTVRYDTNGPDILKDVSVVFDSGKRSAVVGRTGSGKSTVRLLVPDSWPSGPY